MREILNPNGVPRTYRGHSLSKILDTMIGGSVANADLLLRASGLWGRKAPGSNGQFLKVVAGAPDWANTAGGGGGLGEVALARQTTLHTVNNATTGTTFVDTELKVTLDPGTYRFELKNFTTNHSTPDLKCRLHFTGTTSEIMLMDTFIITGNTSYFNGEDTAFDVNAVLTSSAFHTCTYRGTMVVTASGDFSWQGAQNTASATSVTIGHIGGYLIVWQIA